MLYMKLSATLTKEADFYVSCCPILDVASQGCTEKEAMDNLVEAVGITLETCHEMGTLQEFLKSCGFKNSTKNLLKIIRPNIESWTSLCRFIT